MKKRIPESIEVTCDRCKKTNKSDEFSFHESMTITASANVPYTGSVTETYDLCDKCAADFKQWVNPVVPCEAEP